MRALTVLIFIVLLAATPAYSNNWYNAAATMVDDSGWGTPGALMEFRGMQGTVEDGVKAYFKSHWTLLDYSTNFASGYAPDIQTVQEELNAGGGVIGIGTTWVVAIESLPIPAGVCYIDTLEPHHIPSVPEPSAFLFLLVGIGIAYKVHKRITPKGESKEG